jgi:hypothetical protein
MKYKASPTGGRHRGEWVNFLLFQREYIFISYGNRTKKNFNLNISGNKNLKKRLDREHATHTIVF